MTTTAATPDPNGPMSDAEFAALTADPNPPTVVPPAADFLAASKRGEQPTGRQIGSITPAGKFIPAEPEVEEAGQQPAEEVDPTAEPLALAIPGFVPLKEQTPERDAMVQEFARIAPAVGLDAGTAQGLLDMVVDAATVLTYTAPDEHTTAEDAVTAMIQTYGEAEAKNLIARAQRYAASLGPVVQDFLNRTNLGNDISVLTGLALAPGLKQTPAQAHQSIEKLMKTEKYMKGDKLTTIVLHALSRIAHRDAVETATVPLTPKPTQGGLLNRTVLPSETEKAEARAEAAKMMSDGDGALMNSGHKDHAAAVARWQALAAKL